MMVYVLLSAKDVRHAALAERWPGDTLTTSLIRRIERFFDHHPICPADLARVVLTLLPDPRQREFVLDRTNWKLGKQDVNILVLAVIWQGVAVPLLFEFLDHQGNSSTPTRLLMIDDILNLLDCQDVKTLYADREFIGEDWIMGLAERGIPLTVRLRKDTRIDGLPAMDWLTDLHPQAKGLLLDDVEVYGFPMQVMMTWTTGGEALLVASNALPAHKILNGYRKRWKVECLFRALKSKGFKFEQTHMTLQDHLERLFCLLTLAYVWCLLVGLQEECRIKKHGRRACSIITLGLRKLVRLLSRRNSQRAAQLRRLIGLLMPSQT